MPSFSNEQRVAIAIGVPVVAILLYLWFRRRESSEFSDENEDYAKEEASELVTSTNERTIEVKIPQSAVGVIIGKAGANIKKLEKESGARVNLKDVSEENESTERIVLIQGEREKVKRAEILVKKVIAEQPVIRTEEVFVPQRACGRIIGKGGQNIRQMCTVSGARIKIDRDGDDRSSSLRKCFISGTSDQIATAKGLLDEKVAEDKEMQARRGDPASFRNGRAPSKFNTVSASASTGVMQLSKSDEFFEVFVSAIDNPGHFWVQPLTSEGQRLERLNEELTLLYTTSESHTILNAFKVGDVCCAPFVYDSSWYRARILEIHKDGMVDLFYVDFGDTGKISKEKLRELKKEHCQLPFQAVESYLANVRPKDGSWSEKSIEEFDTLTHCAQWVSLVARVVAHCGNIPCLELIDTTGQPDVNINDHMVQAQFAVHDASYPREEPETVLVKDTKGDEKESQETLEVTSAHNVEQQADIPVIPNENGESIQENSSADVMSAPSNGDLQDVPDSGAPGEESADSIEGLQGPMVPEKDSPVKAALVKRISKEFMSAPESYSPGVSAQDAERASLGVVQEPGIEAVSENAVESQPEAAGVVLTDDSTAATTTTAAAEEMLVTAQDKAGYRSTLSIAPSSRRTIAATFSGSRVVSESSESSVKTVSSTVHRQVVSSKQSYVSSVTLPAHKAEDLVLSVSPNVTQFEGESPFVTQFGGESPFTTQLGGESPFGLESPVFKASNESSSFSRHAVTAEVHRTVTQTNGSETKTQLYSSRLEQKAQSDEKPTLTYEINFESKGGPSGTENYTIKKTLGPSLESEPHTELLSYDAETQSSAVLPSFIRSEESTAERGVEGPVPGGSAHGEGNTSNLTPSGSLMDISSNTVIDEEEEYEEDEDDNKPDSESTEPDSDTESFMSAREDMTSDTDTAAYMTAQAGGGSTASLDTDVPAVDSAPEETVTPVNSDTEREDEEEEGDPQNSTTPQPSLGNTNEFPDEPEGLDSLKSLQEQTALLGGHVVSDGDLGYRGDSEEGLTSAEDLRETDN